MATPDPTSALFNRVVLRTRTPVYGRPQPVEGKIVVATTTHAVVDVAPGNHCPLPGWVTTPPAAGTPCLVVWSDQGNPWVISL